MRVSCDGAVRFEHEKTRILALNDLCIYSQGSKVPKGRDLTNGWTEDDQRMQVTHLASLHTTANNAVFRAV